MSEKELTDKQRRVLAFVEDFLRERGFPPTLREIGDGVAVANVNAVRGHVSALEKKGYITRTPDKARSIRVVRSPSGLSRLKAGLHRVLRTDEGVLHRVVYALAWTTWRRRPYWTGPRRKWFAEAIEREFVEHGWRGVEVRIEPDHVAIVVEAWPNHSPEQVVRRCQGAARSVKRRHMRDFPRGRLWSKGYVATTDPGLLDEMLAVLLEEHPQPRSDSAESDGPPPADRRRESSQT